VNGRMIWFNADKRHGFIRTEEGERLLVEANGLSVGCRLPERCRDLPVTFEREERTEDPPHAVGVTLVPLDAPRRARMRGRR
jgi:cold shock CspA family protein